MRAKPIAEQLAHIPIDLHADKPLRSGNEQVRQAARARSDFDNQVVRTYAGGVGELPHQIAVNQKMLPKLLPWVNAHRSQLLLDFGLGLYV